jgi:cell pole-organizing protein PopZ
VDALLNSIRQLVSPCDFPDHIIDLNRPIQTEGLNLSEKTVSESTHVLSSFIHALRPTMPDALTGVIADDGRKKPEQAQGTLIEDVVAQSLKDPLNRWISENDRAIAEMLRDQINQKAVQLLHQWLDDHLPQLIKDSVDRQLQLLIDGIHQKS